jgi:hypothetical protein
MRRKGISSPDIVDTFAFIFLEGTMYTPADNGVNLDPESYGHGEEQIRSEPQQVHLSKPAPWLIYCHRNIEKSRRRKPV